MTQRRSPQKNNAALQGEGGTESCGLIPACPLSPTDAKQHGAACAAVASRR